MANEGAEAQYFLPSTAEEAVALKRAHPDSIFVGGATLVMSALWGKRPQAMIDLTSAGIDGASQDGDEIFLGGAMSLDSLARQEAIQAPEFDALREAARSIEPDVIRATATLGGNISYRSGTLATALSLYEPEVDILSPEGLRSVPLFDLDAGAHELIVSLRIKKRTDPMISGFKMMRRTPVGPGVALVAVSMEPQRTRLCVGAVTHKIAHFEFPSIPSDEELASVLWHGLVQPISDERASALYRVAMAAELGLRLMEELSDG
jgi:CO/xanthine dehydrogenase FAD-binding subunit